jgi:methionyl-tRNA formyltransferase
MAPAPIGPTVLFVGAHFEADAPFRFLLDRGESVVGLVTLPEDKLAVMSGGFDLSAKAVAAGIPVLRAADVNAPEVLEWARALSPDLILVVGWTQLLGDEVLRLPRMACLGFHASLLPKYRGRAPVNWALINGETETGNTMIVLEPDADVGDIVAQRAIPIAADDDCRTLYEKVAATEVEMLDEVWPLLRAGRVPRRKQDDSAATVMPKRRPEDGEIDWRKSRTELDRWVRALTRPYPGAFTYAGGTKVYVWKASPVADGTGPALQSPGTVGRDGRGHPLVAAGDGWLRPLVIQREGSDDATGPDALSSILREGEVLAGATKEAR